jgi:hypothetical protein
MEYWMATTWSMTTDNRQEAVSLAVRLWACAVGARRIGLEVVFVEVGMTVCSIQDSFGLTDRDMMPADAAPTREVQKSDR